MLAAGDQNPKDLYRRVMLDRFIAVGYIIDDDDAPQIGRAVNVSEKWRCHQASYLLQPSSLLCRLASIPPTHISFIFILAHRFSLSSSFLQITKPKWRYYDDRWCAAFLSLNGISSQPFASSSSSRLDSSITTFTVYTKKKKWRRHGKNHDRGNKSEAPR